MQLRSASFVIFYTVSKYEPELSISLRKHPDSTTIFISSFGMSNHGMMSATRGTFCTRFAPRTESRAFATTYNSARIAFVLSLFEYVMPSCAVKNCWLVLLLWLCGDGAFGLLSRTANEPQWLGIERQATDCNESWYGTNIFSRCWYWIDQVFPFLFSGTMDVLHCRTRTCCMRCDLSARAIATITFQGDHKDIQETFSDRT